MAKKAAKSAQKKSKSWSLLGGAAAFAAVAVSKTALDKGWTAVTGKKPPSDPADPDVATWEAVSWAVATGAGIALARVFAQRAAASYYARSTGKNPTQFASQSK